MAAVKSISFQQTRNNRTRCNKVRVPKDLELKLHRQVRESKIGAPFSGWASKALEDVDTHTVNPDASEAELILGTRIYS
jgi:hypothetical protein